MFLRSIIFYQLALERTHLVLKSFILSIRISSVTRGACAIFSSHIPIKGRIRKVLSPSDPNDSYSRILLSITSLIARTVISLVFSLIFTFFAILAMYFTSFSELLG
jgi:hypothetical protein